MPSGSGGTGVLRSGRSSGIVREGEWFLTKEWKASKRVSDGHRLRLSTYFLLIEEEYGVRPPHCVAVLGDGSRVRVRNTDVLRSMVQETADAVRRHRWTIHEGTPETIRTASKALRLVVAP